MADAGNNKINYKHCRWPDHTKPSRQRPIDRRHTTGRQKFVDLREWTTPQKSSVRRQRRWMWALNYTMPCQIDQLLFLLRGLAPEHKDNGLSPVTDVANNLIRKPLPPTFAMRVCFVRPNRQHGVQHQHALLRPTRQIAVRRNLAAGIVSEFTIDILQRRRQRHVSLHREAKPVSLPRAVVGILPQQEHLDLVRRRRLQGGEDL